MKSVRSTVFLMALLLGVAPAALRGAPPEVRKAPPRPVARAARRVSDLERQQMLAGQALNSALDNQFDDALEALREFADLPRSPQPFWREPQYGAALANIQRLASERTADQRFELWRKWTFPDQGRPAMRILVALRAPDTVPEAFRHLPVGNAAAARPGRARGDVPPMDVPESHQHGGPVDRGGPRGPSTRRARGQPQGACCGQSRMGRDTRRASGAGARLGSRGRGVDSGADRRGSFATGSGSGGRHNNPPGELAAGTGLHRTRGENYKAWASNTCNR